MVMTNFPSFSLASASPPDFSLGIEPYEPSYIPSMAEPTDWRAVASQVAQNYNLRPDVFTNMVQAESSFNPYAVSPKGAKGLLQFMPETAVEYGLTDPFDGYANLDAGARYLRKNLDMFGGDYTKAVAAHNAGPGAVQEYGGVPDYPETQNYVSSVMKGIDLNTPLPETPKLEVGTSPSQYTSVQLKSAANPFVSSSRAEDLYRTQKEISALEESKAQALQEMGKQGYMTGQESLAMALTALLPTLIGWGARGNLEGAAGGAQAGALGAGVGFQGIQNEIKRRDDLSRRVFEDANQQLARKEAEANTIRRSIADAEELGERTKYSAEMRSISGLNQSLTPEQIKIYNEMGIPVDENWTQRDVSNFQKVLSENRLREAENRRNNQFEAALSGSLSKTLPEADMKILRGGAALEKNVMPLVERVKEYQKSLPGDKYPAIVTTAIMDKIAGTEANLLRDWLKREGMTIAVQTLGAQGLSNQDAQIFLNFISGKAVSVPGEFMDRIGALLTTSRNNALGSLQILLSQNQYQKNARQAADAYIGLLPPDVATEFRKNLYGDEEDKNNTASNSANSKQTPLTATNPTTGEKLIYTNEGWKPWHQ